MFPSLHCNKNASKVKDLGGVNVLELCSFKGAHTSDWYAAAPHAERGGRALTRWCASVHLAPRLCELFGPSMAAYLVCHGKTPPAEVLTCGTAGWPDRAFSNGTVVNLSHRLREHKQGEELPVEKPAWAIRREGLVLGAAGLGFAGVVVGVAAGILRAGGRAQGAPTAPTGGQPRHLL